MTSLGSKGKLEADRADVGGRPCPVIEARAASGAGLDSLGSVDNGVSCPLRLSC